MTSTTGSSTCVCEKGYYHDVCSSSNAGGGGSLCSKKEIPKTAPTSDSCLRCPQGVNCGGGGNALTSMSVADGFWRQNKYSKDVYPCPVKGACNTSSLNGTNGSCTLGNEGSLCMVCSDGWARWSSNEPCKKCELDVWSVIGSIFLIFLGLAILGVFLKLNRKFPDGAMRPMINGWQQLSIVLTFNAEWPDSVKQLGGLLQSINLELPLAAPTCMGIPFNYCK